MTPSSGDQAFRERMAHIETLLTKAQETADPEARARTTEIVQGLMDLHAAALAQMLTIIGDPAVTDRLARDELVGSVLVLYGLHPLDLQTRVEQALEQARPLLRSHGGNVELVDLTDGAVRVRLVGNCHGCLSSDVTLKTAIENAILARAPDIVAIEVDEDDSTTEPVDTRLPLPMVHA